MHTLASASTMQKPMCEEFDYTSGPTIVSTLGLMLPKIKTKDQKEVKETDKRKD